MTTALNELHKKIKLFDDLVKSGKKRELSEAQTRLDYIDPMLRALGWDVGNSQSLNQFDRDVIVEESIEGLDDEWRSFPDYTFQSSGQRLFFLEAKRPAVDVLQSANAALQIRRYVWSAKLPAGVLTDFEELSLYDGRLAPKQADDSRSARSFYLSYDRYLDEWPLIEERLSKEAVLGGSLKEFGLLDNIPEEARLPFDQAFLADLDRWRLILGKAIARDNQLDGDLLNSSTQLLLDRIVFLRVAEARRIQPQGIPSLFDIVSNENVYQRLVNQFRLADQRYNSGLFHLNAERGREGVVDELTPTLTIADKPLREIIRGLYPPTSPYAFSTVPSDILGSVYERFLSKILVRKGQVVSLELKPELRKQGGVFYTPPHIVRWMVAKAIGGWINDHKADDLRNIRICDPACGSGAFLVGAYEYICEALIRRYLKRQDTVARHLQAHDNGTYSLNSAEKKRVLTSCIFGIDIDPSAVEITKLSLFLAALEGDTRENLDRQLSLFYERALPEMTANILCNNSLLSSTDLGLADVHAIDTLKPLDWDDHPATRDGFDVLLGNPPYVFGEWHHQIQLRVLRNRLPHISQIDLYHAFVDAVMKWRKPDGYWALIIPDAILARDDTAALRREMITYGDIVAAHVGAVFEEAAVSCVILIQGPMRRKALVVEHDLTSLSPEANGPAIPFSTLEAFSDVGFRLSLTAEESTLLLKFAQRPYKVSDLLATMSRGEEFGKRNLKRGATTGSELIVVGEDIVPFLQPEPTHAIPSPSIAKSRQNYRPNKAITIKTGIAPKTAIDRVGYVTLQSVYNLIPRDGVPVEVIAAILNSRVASWYISAMYTSYKKLFPQMNQRHIEEVPVPDLAEQKEIVECVRALEKESAEAKRAFITAKIEEIVCRGYGLSKAERALLSTR